MSQRFMNFDKLLIGAIIIDRAGIVRVKDSATTALAQDEEHEGLEIRVDRITMNADEDVCVDVEETLKGLMTSILMNASATMPATVDPKYLIDATQFMQQIGEL